MREGISPGSLEDLTGIDTLRSTGRPHVSKVTDFPTFSPIASPPFTATKAHMSRQDRDARSNRAMGGLGVYTRISVVDILIRRLPNAFRLLRPLSFSEKVPSSFKRANHEITRHAAITPTMMAKHMILCSDTELRNTTIESSLPDM